MIRRISKIVHETVTTLPRATTVDYDTSETYGVGDKLYYSSREGGTFTNRADHSVPRCWIVGVVIQVPSVNEPALQFEVGGV